MLKFSGERIVPEAGNCEPLFALKMYQEHIARYLFASQAAAGKTVLDIGCGVGYGSHLLARHGAYHVTAFDIADDAIQHAQEFYPHPNLEYLVASAEEFAFAKQFDVITCFELIEHVEHQHQAVRRMAAALKPDGTLFMSTPRPTGKMRSAFHRRELSFLDFSNLLSCYFPYIEWFFENNHFASLVTDSAPEKVEAVYRLQAQFGLGQADYFVALASHSPIDNKSPRPQLVLNDDAYVRNLERDLEILHTAERDFQENIQVLTATSEQQKHMGEGSKAEVENLTRQLEVARTLETDLTAKLTETERDRLHLRTQVASLEATNRTLSAKIAALERNVTRLRRHMANTEAETKRQNDRRRQESAAVISDLVNAREQVRALELERDAERDRARSYESQLNTFESRFNALISSRSWRVTSPLRNLASALRGHPRDPLGIATTQNGVPALSTPASASKELDPSRDAGEDRTIDTFRIPSRPRFDILYIIGCHDGESKRYRAHNLVQSLTELGYRAECWPQEEITRILDELFTARAVILFRCAHDERVERLLDYCRNNRIASIFDIDDLVFEPESIDFVRVLKTFSEADRKQYLSGVELYKKTLLACDRATCTTRLLASRIEALGKRADVIPNSLNERQLEIARGILANSVENRGSVRIGYFSGSNTHAADFEACETAVLSVMERHPEVRFVLVGILDLKSHWDRFAVRIERHSFLPFEQMLAVLSTIDINLAPLELGNPYSESKSQLKIFEAGAVRVPTIASATESFAEAIDHGSDGFLAATTEEWITALEKLVDSPDLRRSFGEKARERALSQFAPQVVAQKAIEVYELPVQQHGWEDGNDVHLKITWIVPGLLIGGGGHRNILRAAYYLEQFGHEVELYFTSIDWSSDQIEQAVRTHFYPLQCAMHAYAGKIESTDVLMATHWSTVDVAMKAREVAGEIMYFVQDFEPAFAPMGTEYILAENTYRLGLYHITSGPWCEAVLKKNFACEADHFLFPVDRRVYHPKPRKKQNKNVVFFAKPEMPRRCFELGVMALEEFHRLCPDIEVIFFGSPHVENVSLPFPVTVRSLLPTIDDLAQLYADADLGIVFSTTNPSLVPYEMMACGLPVVDLGRAGNEINYANRYDIAFLADPVPATMAHQIRELIQDPSQLRERSRRGLEIVQTFPSEEEMARQVEELILKRVAKTRSALVAV